MNTTLAYGSTLILGGLHALEPGHGKSFIVAYLIGEKLSMRHVFALGISLVVSHFFLLTIIALLMRFCLPAQQTEQVHEALSWAGPAIILAFGFYLLLNHRHSHEEHSLGHHYPHGTGNHNALTKSALVGAIGGLLPCPTLIAPLLLSGATNNFHNAVFYILIYIAGMGVVMLTMIVLFYLLKEAVMRRLGSATSKINPHLVSALLIIAVGLVYLFIRIFGHEAHT